MKKSKIAISTSIYLNKFYESGFLAAAATAYRQRTDEEIRSFLLVLHLLPSYILVTFREAWSGKEQFLHSPLFIDHV